MGSKKHIKLKFFFIIAITLAIGLMVIVCYLFSSTEKIYNGEKEYLKALGEQGKYKYNYFV